MRRFRSTMRSLANKLRAHLAVERLEERELLSTTAQPFLDRVYQDLLHRPLDTTGMAAWGDALAQPLRG